MGKNFANYISDKGLISRICKELKKHNNKKISVKKWAKEHEQTFFQIMKYKWPTDT